MRQTLSLVLISSLVLSGCATGAPLRAVSLGEPRAPNQTPQTAPETWRSFAEKLPAGSLVRLRTSDGRRTTGTLLLAEADAITLNPETRITEPARRIPYDQILEIDLVRSDARQLAKAAAIGAGVGGATFLGLLMLIAASWD